MPPSKPHLVLLSYNQSIRAVAVKNQLIEISQGQGLSVWPDDTNKVIYNESNIEFKQEIEKASCLVILYSQHAKEIKWAERVLSLSENPNLPTFLILIPGNDTDSGLVNTQKPPWVEFDLHGELEDKNAFTKIIRQLAEIIKTKADLSGIRILYRDQRPRRRFLYLFLIILFIVITVGIAQISNSGNGGSPSDIVTFTQSPLLADTLTASPSPATELSPTWTETKRPTEEPTVDLTKFWYAKTLEAAK